MMQAKIGIIWDSPQLFTKLVEDSGHTCELITPHLLAAPFFRRSLHAIIIPAGFADKKMSSVLAALRALEDRIRRYVTEGGTVLVFGAAIEYPGAYDWLPFDLAYSFGFFESQVSQVSDHPLACIVPSINQAISCDGVFAYTGEGCILTAKGDSILIRHALGKGQYIVTTIHEYPSRQFLTSFCEGQGETFF